MKTPPDAPFPFHWVFLCLFLCVFLPVGGKCEEIKHITSIRLVYWRAFHGTIEQRVETDAKHQWCIATIVKTRDGPQPDTLIKYIDHEDLSKILQFANDPKIQSAFRQSLIDLRTDGSRLDITIAENSFSVAFVSQDAFMPGSAVHHRELRKLAEMLFRLGGLKLAPGELY